MENCLLHAMLGRMIDFQEEKRLHVIMRYMRLVMLRLLLHREMGQAVRGAELLLACTEDTPLFAPDEPGADFDGNRELIKLGATRFDTKHSLKEQLFAEGM